MPHSLVFNPANANQNVEAASSTGPNSSPVSRGSVRPSSELRLPVPTHLALVAVGDAEVAVPRDELAQLGGCQEITPDRAVAAVAMNAEQDPSRIVMDDAGGHAGHATPARRRVRASWRVQSLAVGCRALGRGISADGSPGATARSARRARTANVRAFRAASAGIGRWPGACGPGDCRLATVRAATAPDAHRIVPPGRRSRPTG